jgi:acyl transferase domain-containing protein/acyl carrier protein
MDQKTDQLDRIAVIGMAGRFPNAFSIEQFEKNLCAGIESVTTFTDEQLLTAGVPPKLVHAPNYVKAGVLLDGVELFDAELFGYNPREAELTDPQHRVFLECAWAALEDAGYDPDRTPLRVGVFAGAARNSYFVNNLVSNPQLLASVHGLQKSIAIDNDFLSTRVSYKLNLKGPGLTIQTACSTSLVATHIACQSLLNGECDMALAGGVSITVPQTAGYLYEQGSTFSSDGRCRAFDASAQGMMPGSGAGVVVLKRLADALEDGDFIRAVICGSAINNDGAGKVGYTAPSVEGQAGVIADAMAFAGVSADEISYVEAHGTGTALGDPIEIAGLTDAFRKTSHRRGFCAIGSVKTNIGHLGPAAGVAGLVKVVLALQNRVLYPSLNFERPSPAIDFANSPFYVQQKLQPWQPENGRRVAGISSFGIGGTNAHAVLEEAPAAVSSGPSRSWQLLPLSANSTAALDTMTENLGEYLKNNPSSNLADVAYTLQTGRKLLNHRRILVSKNIEDAVTALESSDKRRLATHQQQGAHGDVVFMFPGQGAQYANMGLELYRTEPEFQEHIDRCCQLLKPHLAVDLRDVLYPGDEDLESASETLKQTLVAQPALFTIEYALAKLLMSWGVRPAALVGHSIGEYVAACLAGVFSLEDALAVVAARGRLMQGLPGGAMLAISVPEREITAYLSDGLSLAAVNSPSVCVVAGAPEAVAELEERLSKHGVSCRPLHTSHAFHSKMMDPILAEFARQVVQKDLHRPRLPILSSVTGTWIDSAEMAEPGYWVKNLRNTVRFSACAQELMKESDRILLEVGPGNSLGASVRQHPGGPEKRVLSTIRHPLEKNSDVAFLLNTVGRLWLAHVEIDWSAFYKDERRHRIPLPTYAFQRQRYWIEPSQEAPAIGPAGMLPEKKSDLGEWFYTPSWRRAQLPEKGDVPGSGGSNACYLVFLDEAGFGAKLVGLLKQRGQRVTVVKAGSAFHRLTDESFTINPDAKADYQSLLSELRTDGRSPDTIVHLWCLTSREEISLADSCQNFRRLGFNSLVWLAQAIVEKLSGEPIQLKVVSNDLHEVTGDEYLSPAKAVLLGPCLVIPQEHPHIRCTNVDLGDALRSGDYAELLAQELSVQTTDSIVAYRGSHRWIRTFEPAQLSQSDSIRPRLREGGAYLITGGLGGVGLVLAEYLAQAARAKLVLISRNGLPDREHWQNWIEAHGDEDDVSEKIRKVQSIEAQGAEVLVLGADVTDVDQLDAAIRKAHDRFGELHGIIHAAGVAGGGLILLKKPEAAARVMAPKVDGTLLLGQLLGKNRLDFVVLCSSVNAHSGGIGQVDYCSANAFLDAYAQKYHSENNVIAINWCPWQEVGMAVKTEVPLDLREEREESLRLGISPDAAKQAFARVLGRSYPQVIVSSQDFTTLVQRQNQAGRRASAEQIEKHAPSKPAHRRPDLSSDYIVPGNSTEQAIADIWQEFLGVDNVGIHDNFFELGGHSLLATRLVERLRSQFPVELSVASLFENPTVSSLSEMVRQGPREAVSFVGSKSRGQRRREARSQA